MQDGVFDLPQWLNNTSPSHYETDHELQRGDFRYLTVVHNSTGTISLSNITVYWTTSPEMETPAAWTVWYTGAYTSQIFSVDPTTGVTLGAPFAGWYYNYRISNGTSVLVDGGKQNRVVWPGDIVISGLSIFVSTNSLEPIRNALGSLFICQEIDGRLPLAGYLLVQGQYKLGAKYPLQPIDSTGLANVTSSSDWGRGGMGGRNIEANSILPYTLHNALKLAAIIIASISGAANNPLWDELAFIDGIANGTQAGAISNALKGRWVRPYSAPAVETDKTISPFATSFELQAHYMAGHSDYTVNLMEFISHARGWSTVLTSILTFLAGGLTLTSAVGETWKVAPPLGGLKNVQTGHETPLEKFATSWTNNTWGLSDTFVTPLSTLGTLDIPLAVGSRSMGLKGPAGSREMQLVGLSTATIMDRPGGNDSLDIV
ncbi:alpha-L-rhamnosidase [Xylaria acuta]|nr:alpha-L-rhamnosidase [Xylaria acuta]